MKHRIAWLLLTVAVAAHVLDEALNDFLSFYNPTVEAIRETLGWFPMPTFTFATWVAGLVVAVLLLVALTPLAGRGSTGMRILSYVYGVLMIGNGLLHIGLSISTGGLIPGVISSPFLIAAAVFLLVSVSTRPLTTNPSPHDTAMT